MTRKSWREVLFGKQIPPAGTTSDPEVRSNTEILAERSRHAGQSLKDLGRTLLGRPRSPQRVCPYGHPVPPGATTCAMNHYVG